MFVQDINPILLNIFGLNIRYYGLVYVFGFLLLLFILSREKSRLKLSQEDVYDYILFSIIFIIVGARIFEILFYNPSFYFSNPLEMLKIWKGGLSFHGGLLGMIILTHIFTKKKKLHFYDISDKIVLPVAFVLFLGRIANFINGELVGKITDVPWAVKFRNYEGFRHPTQIYEAIKNLLIFFVLLPLKNKKMKKGTLTWLFILLYGALRFFIEFFKEQSSFILGIPVAQIFCFIMIVVSLTFLLKKK